MDSQSALRAAFVWKKNNFIDTQTFLRRVSDAYFLTAAETIRANLNIWLRGKHIYWGHMTAPHTPTHTRKHSCSVDGSQLDGPVFCVSD